MKCHDSVYDYLGHIMFNQPWSHWRPFFVESDHFVMTLSWEKCIRCLSISVSLQRMYLIINNVFILLWKGGSCSHLNKRPGFFWILWLLEIHKDDVVFVMELSLPFALQMNGHNLLQGGGDWTNVIIPGNAQNSGFNHKMTYEVTGLRTDAEYECLVQARNQFGWSEASRIFHFYTGKRGKTNPQFDKNQMDFKIQVTKRHFDKK